MIVLQEQGVIVVATPRTASRAMNEAIKRSKPKQITTTKMHHDWPHEVVRAASAGGNKKYEVWTMIREPMSQLKSWISHCQFWHDPEDFIKTYRSRYFFYEGGMNIYGKTADRFFVYEKGGLYRMLEELGIQRDNIVPVIGATGSSEKTLTPRQEELARNRFKYDFDLYERRA